MDLLQELYVEAQRAEVPDARVYSRADSVALLRDASGRRLLPRVRRLRGRPRWSARPGWSGSTVDNLHLAHLWAWVPPRFGRRGHGTALVDGTPSSTCATLGRRTAVQTWP